MMCTALDDTEPAAMVWMPAHTSEADVGRACLGDGSRLTAFDRKGNSEADRLAKLAVQTHRVPKAVRVLVKEQGRLIEHTARWVAWATWAASHQSVRPSRDTEASRAVAAAARRQRAQARRASGGRDSRAKVPALRPAALGGHRLSRSGGCWSCKVCKAKSKQYWKLAPQRCAGPALARWAEKARALAGQHPADGGGHSRVLSGDVLWCTRCGSYANSVAKGLSKPCSGKGGGGKLGQLKVLQSGRHPKTFAPLPRPVPESCWTSSGLTASTCGMFSLFHPEIRIISPDSQESSARAGEGRDPPAGMSKPLPSTQAPVQHSIQTAITRDGGHGADTATAETSRLHAMPAAQQSA